MEQSHIRAISTRDNYRLQASMVYETRKIESINGLPLSVDIAGKDVQATQGKAPIDECVSNKEVDITMSNEQAILRREVGRRTPSIHRVDGTGHCSNPRGTAQEVISRGSTVQDCPASELLQAKPYATDNDLNLVQKMERTNREESERHKGEVSAPQSDIRKPMSVNAREIAQSPEVVMDQRGHDEILSKHSPSHKSSHHAGRGGEMKYRKDVDRRRRRKD